MNDRIEQNRDANERKYVQIQLICFKGAMQIQTEVGALYVLPTYSKKQWPVILKSLRKQQTQSSWSFRDEIHRNLDTFDLITEAQNIAASLDPNCINTTGQSINISDNSIDLPPCSRVITSQFSAVYRNLL